MITKMKNALTLSYLFLPLGIAASTMAKADDIALGQPSYGGNGCPAGSASVSMSPDASSLSILFDSFSTEAGYASGRSLDRKSCNISIPVHVPQGMSVSIINMDYRGFNSIPQGGMNQFNVEYFFAGTQGPRYQKSFYGPQDGNYLINNELVATAQVWSPCGAEVNLRTNASILSQTNNRNDQTMMTVDSVDMSAGIVYQLQWRTCGGGGYPQPQPTYYPPHPQPQPTYYPPHPQPQPTYYPPHPQPRPTYYPPHPQPRPTYYPPHPQPRPTYYPPHPQPRPTYYPPHPQPRPTYQPPRPQPRPRPVIGVQPVPQPGRR